MTDIAARMGGAAISRQHGGWSLEVRGDEIALIAFDGVPLLRAVRPVVRDRDWNTVAVTVTAQEAGEDGEDGTTLVSHLQFEAEGIRYRGTLTVTLNRDALLVDFQGVAAAPMARNRIGLVILHPADDAGQPIEVRHSDDRSETGRWPTAISPHQPFRDVVGFDWRKSGVTASLTMTGDVFETEDQRNWTDASFKTYSTPLSEPFPVQLEAGATCHQQVRLTATGSATSRPQPADSTVEISDVEVGTVPPISLGAGVYPPPTRLTSVDAGYDTVLVELTGPEDRWSELVRAAEEQADALTADLDVRVVTAEPAAIDRALDRLPLHRVARLAVFDPTNHATTAPLWTALTSSAGERDFGGQLVAGTRAHFTELNRLFDQLPADAPALTFSLTPQMHATEVPHILDSLAIQPTVAANALRLAGPRPVHVGPITLARRFNAVATSGAVDPAVEAARAVDPLLTTDLAAAWTLGSVAALAPTGIASLSYFETAGPRGIRSEDGTAWPVAAVLDQLARLRGRPILEVFAPTGTAALAVLDPSGSTRLLVANLSADPRTVIVRLPTGPSQTLLLRPWAVGDTVIPAG